MTKKKAIFWLILGIFIGLASYNFYPETPLPAGTQIDSLVVYKAERKLLAYANGTPVKTYRFSLGGNPIGHKAFEGDSKTPEGVYYINDKNPNSGYHKNLGISYPNEADIAAAKKLGKSPGGDIKIHGIRNGLGFVGKLQRFYDWTAGCMALTNREMDELYASVKVGAKIEIKP